MTIGHPFNVCVLGAAIAAAFLSMQSAIAATPTDSEVIELLRAQVAALTDRLDALESTQTAAPPTLAPVRASTPPLATPEISDRLRFVGDLRYRHEAFDVEDQRERHRHRVRARASVIADVNEEVEIGFGLASGNDDPVSTNQTLDDGFSSKSVIIELAYARWKTPVDGLRLQAGKFKNPIRRAGGNSLIWDGDLNPEGIAATYSSGPFFGNFLASWLEERSSDDNSYLTGIQFGIDQALGHSRLTAAFGYYDFLNSRGEPTYFDDDPRGNRVDAGGNYLSGFELVEAFIEYSFPLANGEMLLMGDYVRNLAAADDAYDTGFAIGAEYATARWSLGWVYQDVEADAVLGLFTNSDFSGGQTDGKGHILQAGYALTERVDLSGTLFLNKRNIDFGNEEDYKRLQLDVSFKY